jgi:predicted 3-demethylubiquinone-9 3-methyltransferase (glyoxalase superfamily)
MQKIVPFLWFEAPINEVVDFYTSVFKDIQVTDKKGGGDSFMSATVRIHGQEFILFNAGPFSKFSPATSFFINCETQEEVDKLWDKLAEEGKPNRCGWIDDKFGVTWQIVPVQLGRLLSDPDRDKANRAMQAMMKMNKIVIADLEKAYNGE